MFCLHRIITIFICCFFLTPAFSSDDADQSGRMYAEKTFGMTFPLHLSRNHCLEIKKEKVGLMYEYLTFSYKTLKNIDRAKVDKFYVQFEKLKNPLELCDNFLRYTKQGRLFGEKADVKEWEKLLLDVMKVYMGVLIRLETNDYQSSESTDEYFQSWLDSPISFLAKHNKSLNTYSSEADTY